MMAAASERSAQWISSRRSKRTRIFPKPANQACVRSTTHRKVFPRNTRMQHIQDAAQRCTIIDRAPPATFGRGDKLRDQRLQRQPQLFADFSSRHASYDNPLLAVGPVMLAALNPLAKNGIFRMRIVPSSSASAQSNSDENLCQASSGKKTTTLKTLSLSSTNLCRSSSISYLFVFQPILEFCSHASESWHQTSGTRSGRAFFGMWS